MWTPAVPGRMFDRIRAPVPFEMGRVNTYAGSKD
jgi:hypothetical protein